MTLMNTQCIGTRYLLDSGWFAHGVYALGALVLYWFE